MSDETKNLRYELRAYHTADSCRTAAMVLALADRLTVVDRAAVAAEWARRYPRHVGVTGRRSIGCRVGNGVRLLGLVGAVQTDGMRIVVGDGAVLRMIAGNLAIVEADGRALPPSQWPTSPSVPNAQLRAIQASLEDRC